MKKEIGFPDSEKLYHWMAKPEKIEVKVWKS